MLNFLINWVRRYGKSKRYKLNYKPIIENLRVWCNGLLMKDKEDYNYNKKLNTIDFTFLPLKGTKIIIEGKK